MGNEQMDKRKIKTINGWKVNHPFSAANMFYAIFALVMIAFPVAIDYPFSVEFIQQRPYNGKGFLTHGKNLRSFLFRNISFSTARTTYSDM